jgi:hypothetical protein
MPSALFCRRGLVAILAVAFVVTGGLAYAAIPDAGGVIHSCYTKSSGAWRVIDTGLGQTCKANEAAVDVYSKGGADLAFLAKSGKAADSDKLDGLDSAAFLGAGAKAADSDRLDGQDSTAFLGSAAKAVDSDKLDGKDSTEFLGASATATDSAKLGGFPANRYVFGGGFLFPDFNIVADDGAWTFDCCAPVDPTAEVRFEFRCDTAGGSTLAVSSPAPFRWWWDETFGEATPVATAYEVGLPIDSGTSRQRLRAVSNSGSTTTLDLDTSIGATCIVALTLYKGFNVTPGP